MAVQTGRSDGEEEVKVFLRLRPMDKLETSKRSKDCIELHDNPKIITVDSPLLGDFDFTFDQVRVSLFLCRNAACVSMPSRVDNSMVYLTPPSFPLIHKGV